MSKSWIVMSRKRPPEPAAYDSGGGEGSRLVMRSRCGSPTRPFTTASRTALCAGSKRRLNPTMSGVPFLAIAWSARSTSPRSSEIGFSQKIALPASAAATMRSGCVDVGEQIPTASTPGSVSRSATLMAGTPSASAWAIAEASTASATAARRAPRTWPASRRACIEPMWPVPMMPIASSPSIVASATGGPELAAQVVDARLDVSRRVGCRRDAGVDHRVLLEHVPPAVPGALERAHHGADVEVARAEAPEQAATGRGEQARSVRQHARGAGEVDVLQVDERDACRVLVRERDGVDAADRQVAGVEADAYGGASEEVLQLVGPFDERADVGVEHLHEPVVAADLLDDAEPGGERRPSGLVEVERLGPRGVADRRGHEVGAAGAREQLGRVLGVSPQRGAGTGIVQDEGHEAADAGEAVHAEQCGHLLGARAEVAARTELGRAQPERRDLGQDPVPGQRGAPAGHLAHAPGDGRAREAVEHAGRAGAHRRPLLPAWRAERSHRRVALTRRPRRGRRDGRARTSASLRARPRRRRARLAP